jgi:hypothetical protein
MPQQSMGILSMPSAGSVAALAALVALMVTGPARAALQVETRPDAVAAVLQVPPPAPLRALDDRALGLPALLAEGADISQAFSAAFFNAVPIEQVQQIFASLRAQHGAPQRVMRRIDGAQADSGTVVIAFDRAEVTFEMTVDSTGHIAMLRITGAAMPDDSIALLTAAMSALPARTAWGVYRIADNGTTTLLYGARNDEALAIGSSFKLAVLGTLDAEIAAGRMRWADVVAINAVSVPSGQLQNWPIGAPITLHSLATLMISISDNSATDILVRHLGRERVEAFARAHGGLSGPNAFPLLTTVEATVLKNPALGETRTRWLAGDEASRRRLLRDAAGELTRANADVGVFVGHVADIDRIEWFAAPDSIARLMGWFAYQASAEARAILAVNPGVGTTAAQDWAYIGFKGGSEPGVIAMNLLLRNAAGQYFAVSMSWNDPANPVDDSRMVSLIARAVALLPQPAP